MLRSLSQSQFQSFAAASDGEWARIDEASKVETWRMKENKRGRRRCTKINWYFLKMIPQEQQQQPPFKRRDIDTVMAVLYVSDSASWVYLTEHANFNLHTRTHTTGVWHDMAWWWPFLIIIFLCPASEFRWTISTLFDFFGAPSLAFLPTFIHSPTYMFHAPQRLIVRPAVAAAATWDHLAAKATAESSSIIWIHEKSSLGTLNGSSFTYQPQM